MKHSYQHTHTQDDFGLLIAARLSETTNSLPYDISERLRAARAQALSKRKIATTRTATQVVMSGGAAALTFGNERLSWWDRVAAAAPLLALVLGLIFISVTQNDNRANELAEIDSALLIDDLPPSAYADPGFTQFLKMSSAKDQ